MGWLETPYTNTDYCSDVLLYSEINNTINAFHSYFKFMVCCVHYQLLRYMYKFFIYSFVNLLICYKTQSPHLKKDRPCDPLDESQTAVWDPLTQNNMCKEIKTTAE